MPPQHGECVVPAADELVVTALAPLPLPLPLPLAHRIFLLLPVDVRARCSCVCRGWRDALAEPALWTRLDLSRHDRGRSDADVLLRGASGRARGQVTYLNVSNGHLRISPQALLQVVSANARCLRELRVDVVESLHDEQDTTLTVEALSRAAPQLQVLDLSVTCNVQRALFLMRAGPPLRLRGLSVRFQEHGIPRWNLSDSVADVRAFAALLHDATQQPALENVGLYCLDTANLGVMDVLVDAALSRQRLVALEFHICTPPAAAPLARLLAGSGLKKLAWNITARLDQNLGIVCPAVEATPLLDAAGAALVADALRANTALIDLRFTLARLCDDLDAAVALLAALVGHRSLRMLQVVGERPHNPAVLGAALAAIVAADAAALKIVFVPENTLGDVGLAPIVDALPRSQHLPALVIYDNGMSEHFVLEQLLPALHANASLRILMCTDEHSGPAAAEAQALVENRHRATETDAPAKLSAAQS